MKELAKRIVEDIIIDFIGGLAIFAAAGLFLWVTIMVFNGIWGILLAIMCGAFFIVAAVEMVKLKIEDIARDIERAAGR